MIRALVRWLRFVWTTFGPRRPHVLKNDWARVRRMQTSAAQAHHKSQLRPGQFAGRIFGDTQ